MSEVLPRVSILIAVRNEARYLASTLETLVDQDCPPTWLEIFILDGQSTDATVAIALSFVDRLPGLRVLPNPRVLSAAGWNLGISEAKAPVISILSGHVSLPQNFYRHLLEQLTPERAGVGGRAIPIGVDERSNLISKAFSSRMGNGGASFMQSGEPRPVESLAFGCYWRKNVEEIGAFDESIVRGQDWDLNLRLRMAGLELWCFPALEVRYSTRSNFSALWRRQYLAGFWKPYIHTKNKKPFLWRHWIPGIFTAALAATSAGGLIWPWAWPVALGILVAHMCASLLQMRSLAIQWAQAPIFWWAMSTIHLAYGAGFWLGFLGNHRYRFKKTD